MGAARRRDGQTRTSRRRLSSGVLTAASLTFALGAQHPDGCCYYYDEDHCAVNNNGCPDDLVCSDCTADPDTPPYKGCITREQAEALSSQKGRDCIVWPTEDGDASSSGNATETEGDGGSTSSSSTSLSTGATSTSTSTDSETTTSTSSSSTEVETTDVTTGSSSGSSSSTGDPETCGNAVLDRGEECDCGGDQIECELYDEASTQPRKCFNCFFDRYAFLAPAAPIDIFSGVQNMDSACQYLVDQFGIPAMKMSTRPFYTWVSDAQGDFAPANRFHKHAGRYVLPSGAVIAEGWEGLTGAPLKNTISETVAGNPFDEEITFAWSNVQTHNGLPIGDGDDCDGWGNPEPGSQGALGQWTHPFNWSNSFISNECVVYAHFYCFEQGTNTEWIP